MFNTTVRLFCTLEWVSNSNWLINLSLIDGSEYAQGCVEPEDAIYNLEEGSTEACISIFGGKLSLGDNINCYCTGNNCNTKELLNDWVEENDEEFSDLGSIYFY